MIPLLPCPSCGSLFCGPVRCRFTMKPHHEEKDEKKEFDPVEAARKAGGL